jgi:hypothetical protein
MEREICSYNLAKKMLFVRKSFSGTNYKNRFIDLAITAIHP